MSAVRSKLSTDAGLRQRVGETPSGRLSASRSGGAERLRAPRDFYGRLVVPRAGANWRLKRSPLGALFVVGQGMSCRWVRLPDMSLVPAYVDIEPISRQFAPRKPAAMPPKPASPFALLVHRVRSFLHRAYPSTGRLAREQIRVAEASNV